MTALPVAATTSLVVFLLACSGPPREPAIGEAYVGPVTINLRGELSVKSPLVATLRHGERVEIVDRRRRFFKVRGREGVTGWADGRLLVTSEEMEEMHRQTALALKLPSLGRGFVYESLNVHTQPNRQAPSFYQLKENETFEVLTYRLEPRIPFESPILKDEADGPKPARRPRKKTEPKVPPVPRAKPPGLPADYEVISRQPPQDPEYLLMKQEQEAAAPKRTVPIEEWSLIRIRDGRAGWVLSGMMAMGIPDEVAQYAEGHRITSYFSLGEVQDGDKVKHHWLWTTLGSRNTAYQFDGFRVFIWSLSRHRYETTYIERNLTGYLPVTLGTESYNDGRGVRNVPSFAIISLDKQGNCVRRTFAFAGLHVRLVRTEPWQAPPPFRPGLPQSTDQPSATPKAGKTSPPASLGERVRDLRERWFGR